jgi:hypothetical protein
VAVVGVVGMDVISRILENVRVLASGKVSMEAKRVKWWVRGLKKTCEYDHGADTMVLK